LPGLRMVGVLAREAWGDSHLRRRVDGNAVGLPAAVRLPPASLSPLSAVGFAGQACLQNGL